MTATNLALRAGLFAGATAVFAYSGVTMSAGQETAREALVSPKEQIVGAWRLDSIYEEDVSGVGISQFGNRPKGLFMADWQGNFSFQVMSDDGQKAGSPDGSTPSAGVLEALTYSGTYTLDEQDRELSLHVATCLFRSCSKTDRTTEITIRGDTMDLVSAVEASPTGASYSHMVWKRVL